MMTPKHFYHLCIDCTDDDELSVWWRMADATDFTVGHFTGKLEGNVDRSVTVKLWDDYRCFSVVARDVNYHGISIPKLNPALSKEQAYWAQRSELRALVAKQFAIADSTFMLRSSAMRVISFRVATFEWVGNPPSETEQVELRLCFG
jgi:hypothetical protein